MRHLLLRVGPWQTKSVFRIAFWDFRHIFSLADPAGAVYIPNSGYILSFRAGRKVSPVLPLFAAHRRGRSLNPLRGAILELL